jgi:hypothetical protein
LETDAAPAAASKKPLDQTMVMQRGVSLTELETGARRGFDTKGTGFAKKDNKINKIVITVCVVLGLVIVGLLLYVFAIAGSKQ